MFVDHITPTSEPVGLIEANENNAGNAERPSQTPIGKPPNRGVTRDSGNARTGVELADPPRRQRSRLAWWLTAFGVVLGSSVLACCLGWVGAALVFGPTQTKLPSEIEQVAQRMASLHLPPEFQPTWGWAADHSLFWLQIARFDHRDKRGLLLIGELHIRPMPNPHELAQLQQLMEDSSPELRLINPMQVESRTLTIRGADAKFEIVNGEDRASTTKMRQVTGTFKGREGTVLLLLQSEADQLPDAAIEELLTALTKSGDAP